MLIKHADSKRKNILALRKLLDHPNATPEIQQKITRTIEAIEIGSGGEDEVAYYLNFRYGSSKNWAVIHDLRLVHKNRTAQIDHLLINRCLDIWVCESKQFGEGIKINAYGECKAYSKGRLYDRPSPFVQNQNHCEVLKEMLESEVMERPKRLGMPMKPDIKSLVIVPKDARVTRPANMDEIGRIVKADQAWSYIDRAFDKETGVFSMMKLVSSETLMALAREIKNQHTPRNLWTRQFGIAPVSQGGVCALCSAGVSVKIAKFCKDTGKFGGDIYCWRCQKKAGNA